MSQVITLNESIIIFNNISDHKKNGIQEVNHGTGRRNGQNWICGLALGWRRSYCGRRQLASEKFNMNMHHQLEKKDEDSTEDKIYTIK